MDISGWRWATQQKGPCHLLIFLNKGITKLLSDKTENEDNIKILGLESGYLFREG